MLKEYVMDPIVLRAAQSFAAKNWRPLCLDYYDTECFIGVEEDGIKRLMKNEDEYTSSIERIYRLNPDDGVYFILTRNSVYVVSSNIQTRRVVKFKQE